MANAGGSKRMSVKEDVELRIVTAPPGTQLPPEPDLAAELGVSRATLREALHSLAEEGLVRRTRGAGTFVAHRPRMVNNLDANFGVTDAIEAAGMRAGTSAGEIRIEAASSDEAEHLDLEPGEDVVVVDRVRTADDRPVVLSRDIVPRRLFGERALPEDALRNGSLYEVLEAELRVAIHHGLATFRPIQADAHVATRLQVRRGTLLLYLRQVDFDEAGHPVVSSHEHHLADAFEFSVVRRGPGRRHR